MVGGAPKEGLRRHPPAKVAGGGELFAPAERALVYALLPEVEQLVGEHFHLTSFGPVRACYEVMTLEHADPAGLAEHALAKLCRYDRRERPIAEGQRVSRFYRIYLQDPNILARARREPDTSLRSLLLYVLAHELVHVVRFETYQVHYGTGGEAREREEQTVHALTRAVLEPLRDAEVERAIAGLSHGGVDVVE